MKEQVSNFTSLQNYFIPTKSLRVIAKVFVCKQWRGFEFDSGWQRSVDLPFEAIRTRKEARGRRGAVLGRWKGGVGVGV